MRMGFSERASSFLDKCSRKMRRRAELRAQQKQRTRRLLNDKYIRTEGSNAHFLILCTGITVMLLVLRIVGLIFPGISTAFSVMLARNLMMRIVLLIILGTLAIVWIYFLWSLIDIVRNAEERWYESGFLESAPRYEEDEYEPFMYDSDEDEYRCGDGRSADSFEDEEYGAYSQDDSDKGFFGSLFDEEDSDEETSEESAEEEGVEGSSDEKPPFWEERGEPFMGRRHHAPDSDFFRRGSFGARDRGTEEPQDSQTDVHVLVCEREIEGQGRMTLKYSGGYIKGLIRSAVRQFADRLYVKELNVNFLREAFEIEIIADAAADVGHAQMMDELYGAVRQQLGEIMGGSRIDLSLVVQNVRTAKKTDEAASDEKQG